MRRDCTAGVAVMCNEFARLNTGVSTAEESALAMRPSGNTLCASWGQFAIVNQGQADEQQVCDAAFARVWYDDANSFTMPPAAPLIDAPIIGNGGGDAGGGDDGNGGSDDDDNDGPMGCTINSAEARFDPLLPALVLLSLLYLGLRRRRGTRAS